MDTPSVMPKPVAVQNSAAIVSFLRGFFSFDTFIIPGLLKVVYIIGVILIPIYTIGGGVLGALYAFYYWYNTASAYAPTFFEVVKSSIWAIVIGIVMCLLGILLLRLYCELLMVIFKINENLQAMRNQDVRV